MFVGVIRAGWEVPGLEEDDELQSAEGTACTTTGAGLAGPARRGWDGMQYARENGDRIGMLLDLDQGSMTVWKNDEKMGVMQAEGLSGPLCWAVSLLYEGSSARIESSPPPESPTEEELAAARAWQRRSVLSLPQTATDAECEAAEAAA